MIPPDRLELLCYRDPPPPPGRVECAAIKVHGRHVSAATKMYAGTGVEVVALVDTDCGMGKSTVRQIASVAAAKDGANAIEVAMPCDLLRAGAFQSIGEDLIGIVSAVREVSRSIAVYVCIETVVMMPEEFELVRLACLTIRESGCDGIVPSLSRTSVPEIQRIREYSETLKVIAHGGGHDEELWQEMLGAGADRVFLPYLAAEYEC